MVFAFATAIIAGFLLTAVQTWTGQPSLSGKPLAVIALIWLAGRLGWLLNLPLVVLIPLDLLFLVALAVNGVPIDVLAEHLGTTRGALYKTLHDARRKLRGHLEERGLEDAR